MRSIEKHSYIVNINHSWWHEIRLVYLPGERNSLIENVAQGLLEKFEQHGHLVQSTPDDSTDVILTTALFGKPIRWREALLFTARRKYHLNRLPTIFTMVNASIGEFHRLLNHFDEALAKSPPEPMDFMFPGLTSKAFQTLYEQGQRGGPILSLVRLLQSQTLSIRVILIVGDDQPLEAYTFDLVGAHPRTDASDLDSFYQDLMNRIVTAVCTHEITDHYVITPPICSDVWKLLKTPNQMRDAGRQIGRRGFFTEMVQITNLVNVPSIGEAVARQYSEGCFATWDATLGALITTITGSARPVEKHNLTDDELAVIVGVREDGKGALVRHVEGKRNDPPSSEAVELIAMDKALPRIRLESDQGKTIEVPVVRSKLHGHRGVKAYDPTRVEHVYLDPPYYHYPVSCSTKAQAEAIVQAFSRSEALTNPDDPRQVVFTVLPGHGVVIVEKWLLGKAPFQLIWEYMDDGTLQIENTIPQGPLTFLPNDQGMMVINTD